MKESEFNLPSPQMLIKKAKEETIPVSLRVKESTVAIFDKMAKAAGVNRGAMMNTWLDFYAQSQNSSNQDNSKDIMISFLNSERFWKKIPSLSAESLIYRIPTLMDGETADLSMSDNPQIIYESYRNIMEGYDEVEDLDNLQADIDGYLIAADPSYDEEEQFAQVSHEQWPLVVVLLAEYRKKYKKLFPEQKYAITPSMYKKISDACEKYQKPDSQLATAIKEILLDFVENQND